MFKLRALRVVVYCELVRKGSAIDNPEMYTSNSFRVQ